jgi:hypothetical protein
MEGVLTAIDRGLEGQWGHWRERWEIVFSEVIGGWAYYEEVGKRDIFRREKYF